MPQNVPFRKGGGFPMPGGSGGSGGDGMSYINREGASSCSGGGGGGLGTGGNCSGFSSWTEPSPGSPSGNVYVATCQTQDPNPM